MELDKYFSKNFDEGYPYDFSTRGARAMAAEGKLEMWLQAYLTSGPWANAGLASGLRRIPSCRYELLELPVGALERKCGPEPEMIYRQDEDTFERHTHAIETTVEALDDLPPVVVEDLGERLVVCDGTHRLEAIRRRGWTTCWAILFSTT